MNQVTGDCRTVVNLVISNKAAAASGGGQPDGYRRVDPLPVKAVVVGGGDGTANMDGNLVPVYIGLGFGIKGVIIDLVVIAPVAFGEPVLGFNALSRFNASRSRFKTQFEIVVRAVRGVSSLTKVPVTFPDPMLDQSHPEVWASLRRWYNNTGFLRRPG